MSCLTALGEDRRKQRKLPLLAASHISGARRGCSVPRAEAGKQPGEGRRGQESESCIAYFFEPNLRFHRAQRPAVFEGVCPTFATFSFASGSPPLQGRLAEEKTVL
eukprot:6203132-Pleurochrysis_carterae.AAC.5